MKNPLARLIIAIILLPTSLFAQFFQLDTLQVAWEKRGDLPDGAFQYAKNGDTVFAGTYSGLFKSADNGDNWQQMTNLPAEDTRSVFMQANLILVVQLRIHYDSLGNEYHAFDLYRSADGGLSFGAALNFVDENACSNCDSYSFHEIIRKPDGTLYLLYRSFNNTTGFAYFAKWSSDDGQTWQDTAPFQPAYLCLNGNTTYATLKDTLYVSQQADFSDVQKIFLPQQTTGPAVYFANGKLYLRAEWSLIKSSDDGGLTWTDLSPLPSDFGIIETFGNDLYYYDYTDETIWKADDASLSNWSPVYTSAFDFQKTILGYDAFGNTIFVSGYGGLTYRSTDGGGTWEIKSDGMDGGGFTNANFALVGDEIWALGADNAIFHSLDDGLSWQYLASQSLEETLDAVGMKKGDYIANIFAHQGKVYVVANADTTRLLRSDDGGLNWKACASPDKHVFGILTRGFDNRLFTQGLGASILWYSDDEGENWQSIPTPSGIDYTVIGDTIVVVQFAGGSDYPIKISNDLGANWQSANLPLVDVEAVFYKDGKLIVEGDGGVFLSTDRGQTWTQTGQPFPHVIQNQPPYEVIVPYTYQDGVLFTSHVIYNPNPAPGITHFDMLVSGDFGESWSLLPLPQNNDEYFIKNGMLYSASSYGLWRTPQQDLFDQLDFVQNNGTVNGHVFYDMDGDCTYGPGDLPFAGKVVEFSPENAFAVSNALGEFQVGLPPNTYEASFTPTPYFDFCENPPIAGILVSTNSVFSLEIPLKPIPGIYDLEVFITALTPARPGFPTYYQVNIFNRGTEPVSGAALTFEFPQNNLSFMGSTPIASLNGGTATIPLPDLGFAQSTAVQLHLLTANTVALGTQILVHATATHPFTEMTPDNNEAFHSQRVVGSFDPNDKTSYPSENILPLTANEIQYLIRFQNTGTDTAFKVVVLDTFDTRFDLLTLETITASHPFEMQFRTPHVVAWVFSDILLPDSSTNEAGSHGFVHFSIKTKGDITTNDTLRNTAAIYFDFNEPVITNEAVDAVQKGIFEQTDSVTLCAGEEYSGSIYFENTTLVDSLIGEIWDSVFVTEITVLPTYTLELDTALLPGETYNGVAIFSDTVFIENLLAQNGCDSTVTTHISLLTGTDDKWENELGLKVFPNPTSGEFSIEMNLPKMGGAEAMKLSIEAIDPIGRRIKLIAENDLFQMGKHRLKVNASQWPSGIYLLRFQVHEVSIFKKIIKV